MDTSALDEEERRLRRMRVGVLDGIMAPTLVHALIPDPVNM